MQIEAFDWASASITRTSDPCAASVSANATTVAVLPTPPFIFATAMSLGVTLHSPRQSVAAALPREAALVHRVFGPAPGRDRSSRLVGDDNQIFRAGMSARSLSNGPTCL